MLVPLLACIRPDLFSARCPAPLHTSGLHLQCARALVTSHDYQRAIDYYTKAIANARGGAQVRACAWW